MTKASRLWLLLPALFALAWYWPVLFHGFRSDDFLTVYYFDRDAESVKWGRVLEEWVRPWFGVRDLYRPVVSLTYGLNWALSTSPFGFHLLNVLLLLGTGTAVGLAVRRLAPGNATPAAVAAAVVVLLHPAAVEPAAWIAARTTGLQVFFSALAYWTFLRWRDGAGSLWPPLVATFLACASKEGAVLLPASLVVLDLLRRPAHPSATPRWRACLPFFALVAGYLVWRRVLLGVFTTAEDGHTLAERFENAGALFAQLVAPPADSVAFAIGLLVVLLGAPLRALLTVPWAALLLLPGTTHVVLDQPGGTGQLAGRFVFDAVPALAIFVGLTVGATSRLRARCGVVGAIIAAVGLVIASGNWITRYDDENVEIRAAQEALQRDAAAASRPGRPFGVAGLPALPMLQRELWGFLTQRPFADADLAVVGLDHVLTKNATSGAFNDAVPLALLARDGAGVGWWQSDKRRLLLLPDSEPGQDAVELVRNPAAPTQFLPPRPLSPLAALAIEITTGEPGTEWRVELLGALGGDFGTSVSNRGAPARGQPGWWGSVFLPWFVTAPFGGGPAGIDVRFDLQPPPAGTVVRAHARLPRLEGAPSLPAELGRDAFLARVVEPPAERENDRMARLYVLLPTGVFALDAAPGAPTARLTPALQNALVFVCDVLGPTRVHWAWVELGDPPTRPPRFGALRSAIVR